MEFRKGVIFLLVRDRSRCHHRAFKISCHFIPQQSCDLSFKGEVVKLKPCAVGLSDPPQLLAKWQREWANMGIDGHGVTDDTCVFAFVSLQLLT